jgi:hypothetical protein
MALRGAAAASPFWHGLGLAYHNPAGGQYPGDVPSIHSGCDQMGWLTGGTELNPRPDL